MVSWCRSDTEQRARRGSQPEADSRGRAAVRATVAGDLLGKVESANPGGALLIADGAQMERLA